MSLITELKRRNVFKVAVAYAVVSWLLIQIVTAIEEPLGLPGWTDTLVIVLLGIGLPIALIISWAFELTPEGLKPTHEVDASESITHSTGRKIDFVIIGVLVLAVGFLLVDRNREGDSAPAEAVDTAVPAVEEPVAEAPPVEQAAEPAIPERQRLPNSVAVLPFENMSDDPEDAYFASGIHEETLNRLAKLSELSVISRTSMLRYTDTEMSVPEIAEELNVETVLEGSVRYAGDRVRVTAQLINAATDEHLWSEVYEREFADIFFIQSDIATNIANAMEAEFSLVEQAQIERIPTASVEAHALILKILTTRTGGNTAGIREAIVYAAQALEFDPEYAEAHGHYALLHTGLIQRGEPNPEENERIALESAARALELDPENDEALRALARIAMMDLDWDEAEARFSQAHDSGEPLAVRALSQLNLIRGDFERAVEIARDNVDINPASTTATLNLIQALMFSRELDEAAIVAERAISQFPDRPGFHLDLARIEMARGNIDEALKQLELMEQLQGNSIWIAYAWSVLGQDERAQAILDELLSKMADEEIGRVDRLFQALIENDGIAIEDRVSEAIGPGTSLFWLTNWKQFALDDPRLQIPEFDAAYAAIGL